LFLWAFDLRVKRTGGIQTADLFFRVGLDMKERGDILRCDVLGKVNAAGSAEKANKKKRNYEFEMERPSTEKVRPKS
jgi:hypothetical protein